MSAPEARTETTPLLKAPTAPRGLGQRHLLALLSGVGIMAIYCMRVNMSVALVAMVNSTAVFEQEFAHSSLPSASYCPATNTSSFATSDGTFVWSRPLQGAILSAFYWGCLLLQVPSAVFVQRQGAKWLFGFGVLWSSILTVLVPAVTLLPPGFLVALRAAQGIGEGVVYPALNCLLGLWVPPTEASLLTTVALEGDALGLIVGQAASGMLCASSWGWPSSFYACGGVGIVWFILWAALTSDRPETSSRITEAERRYITQTLHTGGEESTTHVPWRRILTDSGVWANLLTNVALYWVVFTLLSCLPQFLSDVLRLDIRSNGLASALPNAFCFLIGLLTAAIADKIIATNLLSRTAVRKLFCSVGFSISGAAILGVTFTGCNVTVTLVLLNVAVGALGLQGGGLTPNVFDLSPELSASIEAIGNSLVIVVGIATPALTDALTSHGLASQWYTVFRIGAAISIAGAVIFAVFGSGDRRDWNKREEEAEDKALVSSASVNASVGV